MGYNHQWAVELFQEFLTRYQKELTAPMICAAEFAIDAHKGQTRKSSDIPYVSHLFEVAGILICLLYTSPSPRDTERSRMPSSA